MSVQRQIGAAPIDLVAALALEQGQRYLIQPLGLDAISIWESAAAPADRVGHPVPAGGTWAFTAGSTPIWAWSAQNTVIGVSEA